MRPEFILDKTILKEEDPLISRYEMGNFCTAEEIEDFAWRFMNVPILSMFRPEDIEEVALEGETKDMAVERFRKVREWTSSCGGPENAFRVSPIIAVMDGDTPVIVDGWHRCVVAMKDYGIEAVRTFLGNNPFEDKEMVLSDDGQWGRDHETSQYQP